LSFEPFRQRNGGRGSESPLHLTRLVIDRFYVKTFKNP